MTLNPWSLPSPLDVLAVVAWHALEWVWWLLVTPTRNVAELGPWYPPVYWLAVYLAWCAGTWGSATLRTVRRGTDFLEFDPQRRGGAWAGRLAVQTIRLQVAGEAWVATAAIIAGYGGLLVLLAVGVLWRWLAVIGVAWLWWMWRARTRTRWWENAAG